METGKRRKLFNVLMVVIVAVIVFCGIMAVGIVKGWFGGGSDSDQVIVTEKVSGVANIERSGVGYSLKEDVPLKDGDVIETETGSEIALKVDGSNSMTMNENAELAVSEGVKDTVSLQLNRGEIFADCPQPGESMQITLDKSVVSAGSSETGEKDGAVFALSSQTGSASVSVLKGTVKVAVEDGTEKEVSKGQTLAIAHDGSGKLSAEVSELKAASMDDFMLTQAAECESSSDLCFTAEQIKKVQKERSEEKAKAAAAAESQDTITGTNEEGTAAGSSGGSSSKSGSSSSSVKSCTIQIRCDTILNNMGNLTAGKNQYVPANGVILASSRVEFADGETVFDVLKRVCSYTGIQLEYSYTPLYGSYYIEGINNLYEFDCGEQSGWMYKVNGWFPNYGCSSYTLKDGDNIVWCYTCNGLGADVGGGM